MPSIEPSSSKTEISRESVNGSLKLCEYFKTNIETVLSKGTTFKTSDSKKDQFFNELPEEFDSVEASEIAEKLDINRTYKYKCLNNTLDYQKISETPNKWKKLL